MGDGGLSDHYNNKSGHNAFHWGHLALMITGMALPMVASAAPLASATALDVVVQTGHMVLEMIVNTLDYTVPVLGDVWTNAMDGNFMPTTWEAGSMHGMDHGVQMLHGTEYMAEGFGHAAHVGVEDQIAQFNEWTMGIPPDELALIKTEANLVYGETLFDYFQSNFLTHE